jgi:hypothetical protein
VSSLADRAAAARQLIGEDPSVDPLDVLALVVWPTAALEAAEARKAQPVTDVELEAMRRLAAQGVPHREIGEQLGRPKSTVGWALRRLAC